MKSAELGIKQATNTQFVSLTWRLNHIEERLQHLQLRHELFTLPGSSDDYLFVGLPARLGHLRQALNQRRTRPNADAYQLQELTRMLKDLERDLGLRESLQAQRSLINYLNHQDEVYHSLIRRWRQLANAMVSIDALTFSDAALADQKREELEAGLKELGRCLQSTTPQINSSLVTNTSQADLTKLAQAS